MLRSLTAGLRCSVFVAVLWSSVVGQAAVVRYLEPLIYEPDNHASFVRNDNPAGRQIAAWDSWYAQDLVDNVTAGSVDLLFQECFGGGFHNDIVNSGLARYTTASATRYNEAGLNKDNVNAYFNFNKGLDNFTRAYRDSALARSTQGVHDSFQHASDGGDGITKDPYAIADFGKGREHPHYWTPDATASNVGANNSRTLTHTAGAGNANEYAILVAWDHPEDRHAVNIARLYDLLRDVYGLPADNIVVLYGNSARGNQLGDWRNVDSNAEYDAFIDGNNRRATWLSAVRGNLFSTNNVVGGNVPDANDKLFIYNTGHGGHAWRRDGVWTSSNMAGNVSTGAPIDLQADGLSFDFDPVTEEASSIMNDPLGTGSMKIQLLLTDQINPSAIFNIPSVASVPAGSAAVLSPSEVYSYDGVLSDSLFAYQFDVPYSNLASVADDFQMQIDGLDAPFVQDSLVAALSFFGGDQEQAYLFTGVLPVPEPSALVLLLIGGASLAVRRCWTDHGAHGRPSRSNSRSRCWAAS